MQCNGFQFEIGKTFMVEGPLDMCVNGFHSCKTLFECTTYYKIMDSRAFVCEIDETKSIYTHNKFCSSEITLVRELNFNEVMRLLNFQADGRPLEEGMEQTNLGFFNRGSHNHGNYNRGNNNQGHGNWGNDNQGNDNRGDDNQGHDNWGNYNHGNGNYGNDNYGNDNYGNYNHNKQ